MPIDTPAPSESPVLSVAEMARRLRRAIEGTTGNEWVRGEVASSKCATSGHHYFTLKDEREDALIECVMYRGQSLRYKGLMVDGARIQIMGKATLWAPRGRLQFVVERLRPDGRGSLLEALERLKRRLHDEGLFASERKRPLPSETRIIGVVTSATGAAFWDVVAVAHRRGAAHLVLSPAQVQGEGAVERLLAAMDLIERHPEVDVIVIGRGGGAGEDLMAFNDERLVRRIARARVPVVSAVGHDIDATLSDLVADHRAATPSQAAELIVADRFARCSEIARTTSLLVSAMRRRIQEDRGISENLRVRLKDPRFVVLVRQQRLDEYRADLEAQLFRRLRIERPRVERLSRRLGSRDPRLLLALARQRIVSADRTLTDTLQTRLLSNRNRLKQLEAVLDSLSPLSVLGRGYAIASRLDGRVIRGPADVKPREAFRLRLGQGEIRAVPWEKGWSDRNDIDAGTREIDHEEP